MVRCNKPSVDGRVCDKDLQLATSEVKELHEIKHLLEQLVANTTPKKSISGPR